MFSSFLKAYIHLCGDRLPQKYHITAQFFLCKRFQPEWIFLFDEVHKMIDDCKKIPTFTSTSNIQLRSFLYIMNAPPWEVIASGIQATLSMDILPFSPFPWGFIAEKAIICYEISFWSIWASVSAMSPHNLLLFLSRFALKAEWRKALMLC